MICYIVHYRSKGYYVSYKDKLEDNFSRNYIDAKRYKTLGFALGRLMFNFKNWGAREFIRDFDKKLQKNVKVVRRQKISKINNEDFEIKKEDYESIDILDGRGRIDVLEINGNNIKFLGKIPNKEIYDHINKESQNFLNRNKYYSESSVEIKDATPEDIDDFCSMIDNIVKKDE